MLRHLFFQFFFCSVVYHRRQQMYVCRSHFVNIYDSICSVGRNEFLEKFINSDTPCFYSDIQRSDRNEPKRWQYFDFFFLHSKYNSTKLQTTNYKRNGIFHARYEFLNYYCIRFYMAVCRRHSVIAPNLINFNLGVISMNGRCFWRARIVVAFY